MFSFEIKIRKRRHTFVTFEVANRQTCGRTDRTDRKQFNKSSKTTTGVIVGSRLSVCKGKQIKCSQSCYRCLFWLSKSITGAHTIYITSTTRTPPHSSCGILPQFILQIGFSISPRQLLPWRGEEIFLFFLHK